MKRHIGLLLLSAVVIFSTATSVAQTAVDIYGEQYKARLDSLWKAGDWAATADGYIAAGRQAVADGALKTATRFYSQAERAAIRGSLAERLVDISYAQTQIYDRRKNDKAALICLKRYVALRDSLAVVDKLKAEADAVATEKAAAIEAERQAAIEAEAERNKPNPFVIYYIIIGVAALYIIADIIISCGRRRRSRRYIASLEKQCEINTTSPLEIALTSERVCREAEDIVRNCRKEGFDIRTEILPLMADSRALALTAYNIVACYEQKYAPEPTATDLDKILKRAAKEFESSARLKGVKIDYKSTGAATVTADTHLIELAVCNLVSNAVKYSPEGKTVSLWIESPERKIIVGIEDKGVGIDHTKIEAMLAGDLYERTEGTAGETGLGLGLKVCRRAATASSAELRVISSTDGTTATLTFKQ